MHASEIETGSVDRTKNMVEFAKGALQLLLTAIQKGNQKL